MPREKRNKKKEQRMEVDDDDDLDEEKEELVFIKPGRGIHRATHDQGLSEKVLYAAHAPESYSTWLVLVGTLTCNPCLVANSEQVRHETYVTVYENKIEISRPCLLWCCTMDRINVLYLDRDEFNQMTKAGRCSPGFTHCSLCPTFDDYFGEGLVLHGGSCCSKHQSCVAVSWRSVLLCHPSKLIYPVEDAEELREVIELARNRAMERARAKRSFGSTHQTRTLQKLRSKRSQFLIDSTSQNAIPQIQDMQRT